MYQESQYNFYARTSDGLAVFNTFTGAMVVLDPAAEKTLHSGNGPEAETMHRLGLLADSPKREKLIMQHDRIRSMMCGAPAFRILTTTACNARCPYCYEKGLHTQTMSEQTAEKVGTFIAQHVTPGKAYRLEWFGGEPTLTPQIITQISDKLAKEDCLPENVSMVSNGYLFDEQMVQNAVKHWNLNKIQIALDGTAGKYDAVKQLPDRNAFARVIRNIHLLADAGIYVSIRLNVGKENFADIIELERFLAVEFPDHTHIHCYGYPLFSAAKAVPKETAMLLVKLNERMLQDGLIDKDKVYNFRYRESRCLACSYNGYTIMPDGKLANCSHTAKTEGSIGTVENASPYNMCRMEFVQYELSEECRVCQFLPICQGGCRAAELGLDALNQCFPYKNVFSEVLEQVVRYGLSVS